MRRQSVPPGWRRRDRALVRELGDVVVEGGKVHHVRAEIELRELIVACSLRSGLPVDVAGSAQREGAGPDQLGSAS